MKNSQILILDQNSKCLHDQITLKRRLLINLSYQVLCDLRKFTTFMCNYLPFPVATTNHQAAQYTKSHISSKFLVHR